MFGTEILVYCVFNIGLTGYIDAYIIINNLPSLNVYLCVWVPALLALITNVNLFSFGELLKCLLF